MHLQHPSFASLSKIPETGKKDFKDQDIILEDQK
jgi:hypothetical protein